MVLMYAMIDDTYSNIFCAECTHKVVKYNNYITCNNCSLDFHINCIDDIAEFHNSNNCCKYCFFKIGHDELPFNECKPFINLRCKLQKGLKIVHLNIQSMINKIDHIELLLHDNQIHILCLTETWLDDNIDNSDISINGYNVCRLDRNNGESHGGIVCYVRNDISFKHNSDLNDNDIEALWVEINLPKTKPILVGTVYRPPSACVDYVDRLDSIFQECNSLYDDVYILGDFNLDTCKRPNSKKVNNLAQNSHMNQLICDYTRITNVSQTIIDLIFVSRPELVVSSGVHSLGLSDHSLIYVVRKHKQIKIPPRTVKSRCFKKFSDESFISNVQKIDWDQITYIDDVNAALYKWQSLFTGVCDSQAPFREKRIKGHLPEWVNYEFLKLSKDRDYYYAKAHKSNEQVYWNMAKTLRNKVNNMKFYLKKNYYNEAITNNMNNSKNLWKVIKKIIPNKSSPVPNNIVISDDGLPSSKGTANAFNNYFSTIGNKLGEKFNTNNDTDNDDSKRINCPCNNSCSKFNKDSSDHFRNKLNSVK